jgi:signal transduction histidine kinase
MKSTELALRHANRSLALLNSITRHDVINQTMTIEGCAALIPGAPIKDQDEMAIKIEHAARNIRNHMEFTRLYQDVGAKEPTWQDLERVFQKAISSLPLKDLKVVNNSNGIHVLADPLFEKAIYNLVENVVRHADGAKNLDIFTNEDAGLLTVHVRDDGAGVQEEMKKAIFDAGVGANTGFGLFLAREVLKITGFGIAEVGAQGKGADFAICVPPGSWKRNL